MWRVNPRNPGGLFIGSKRNELEYWEAHHTTDHILLCQNRAPQAEEIRHCVIVFGFLKAFTRMR